MSFTKTHTMRTTCGKRITLRKAKQNLIFENCLEKLWLDAKAKNSKYEPLLRTAMTSLSRYPLPLRSGADCAILKGFNKMLCLLMDQCLKKYNLDRLNSSKSPGQGVMNIDDDDDVVLNNQPSKLSSKNVCLKKKYSKHITKSSEEAVISIDDDVVLNEQPSRPTSENVCLETYNSNNLDSTKSSEEAVINIEDDVVLNQSSQSTDNQTTNSSNQKVKHAYKPVFRSGGYGILMGLLEHSKRDTAISLKKDDLIEIAQKYSEESFTVSKSERYSAWSSMGRLLKKGLVKKSRTKNAEYALTVEGALLANTLWKENKNKPSINNLIFHKSPSQVPSKQIISSVQNLPHVLPSEDKTNGIESTSKSSINVIKMQPNSFDIILLIDKNETNGSANKHDPFRIYPDLKYEARSLKVGDFTWIARHKIEGTELVLPYIVERKRMDDLGASIKDGRFHEQKFRLRKCGLKNVIYLVESYEKNKHVGLPLPSLLQALANTRIQDGFKVYATDSLVKTNRFLAMMTRRLEVEFKDKFVQGQSAEPTDGMFMTFDYFNKSSTKSKVLTVTEMFIKMLLQLKGMSVEKALAITSIYKTPKSLMAAYETCSQKEGEFLLANLKYGDLNRNVGPSVSIAVFHLFTF